MFRKKKAPEPEEPGGLSARSSAEADYLGRSISAGVQGFADRVAPGGYLLEKDCVRVGSSRLVRAYAVTDVPRTLAVGFLEGLFRFRDEHENLGDVDLSVRLTPVSNYAAVRKLTNWATQLEAQAGALWKQGQTYLADQMAWGASQAKTMKDAIERGGDRMFFVTVLILLSAPTRKALELQDRLLMEHLGGMGVHAKPLLFRQDEGFRAAGPQATDEVFDLYRNFSLGGATALFPFLAAELSHPEGVYIGNSMDTASPAFYDQFTGPPQLPNSNMLVFATSGGGKSFFLKLLVARSAADGVRSVIIDPEGEYRALAETLGGVYLPMKAGDAAWLNPLDVEVEEEEGPGALGLREKVLEVKNLLGAMAEMGNLEVPAQELTLSEEAIWAAYAARGITDDPSSVYGRPGAASDGVYLGRARKQSPTLSDLHRELKARGCQALALALSPYLSGKAAGIFDGPSRVQLADAPVVCFDVSALDEKYLRPLAMHVTLSWVQEKFVKKFPGVKKRIVVDEAWMFMKHRGTAEFLENMVRRARKRTAALTVASQSFTEFSGCEEGRAVLGNASTVALGKQESTVLPQVVEAFHLSEGETRFLARASTGEMLFRAGGYPHRIRVVAFPGELEFAESVRTKKERGGAA